MEIRNRYDSVKDKLTPSALHIVDSYLRDLVPTFTYPPQKIEPIKIELMAHLTRTIEVIFEEGKSERIRASTLARSLERAVDEYEEEGKSYLAYHVKSLAEQLRFVDQRLRWEQ